MCDSEPASKLPGAQGHLLSNGYRAVGLPGGHCEELVSSYLQKPEQHLTHWLEEYSRNIWGKTERKRTQVRKSQESSRSRGHQQRVFERSRVPRFLCEQTPEVCPGRGRQKSLGPLWRSGRLWKGAYESIPWLTIQLEVITHCGPVCLLGACLVPTSKPRNRLTPSVWERLNDLCRLGRAMLNHV